MALRTLLSKSPLPTTLSLLTLPTRSISTRCLPLRHLRPLLALPFPPRPAALRCLSTSRATSSLNDPSPNWSNRPPKETILLDGCDFEHWLVVVEPPDASLTRDEIIGSYIKTLAQVVGSEEEARFKIYSVSTKHYFAFGALVSEELSYKLKELPGVRWVLPDSYLDVKNKDYGGEPFINGEAVPYDPKYHEEWVRNNARANERNRRNDRPRNSDRSRNFERRRENMQNFQNRPPMPPPPLSGQDMGGQGGLNPSPAMPNAMPPRDGPNTGVPTQMPNYQSQMPPRDDGGMAGGSYPLGNNAHQGFPNAFQGGAGGYQGPPNAYQGGRGGYQAPSNPYQGGPSYQSPPNALPNSQETPNAPHGPAGYQGTPNSAQGGPVGFGYQQSPSNAYQGGPGAYQGGAQGLSNAYQGDAVGNAYQGGGAPPASSIAYQGGGGPYQQPQNIS